MSDTGHGAHWAQQWIADEIRKEPEMKLSEWAAQGADPARLHESVKPLEWIDNSEEDYVVFNAEGIANLGYYVADYPDGSWGWFTSFLCIIGFSTKTEQRYSGLQGKAPTLVAAKAAAQTHYAAQLIAGLDL